MLPAVKFESVEVNQGFDNVAAAPTAYSCVSVQLVFAVPWGTAVQVRADELAVMSTPVPVAVKLKPPVEVTVVTTRLAECAPVEVGVKLIAPVVQV